MKIEIEIKVSKSNSSHGDPKVKKSILIDIPGSDFESLNLPNYIQATLEESLREFKQLPLPEATVEENEIPF